MSTWANTPRFLPRALVLSVSLALLFVFLCSVPAFAVDPVDPVVTLIVDDDAPGCGTSPAPFCTIQAAIDAAHDGYTIKVYPGVYDETAAGRYILGTNGPYQFGLFIDKNNVTVQGVDASGNPIDSYSNAAAFVTTNATNNFGPSGIFVQGNNVTITGLKIGPNKSGENKTIEIIGDNFVLKFSRITVPGGGSVYFNDWSFDVANNVSHIQGYTIEGNLIESGTSIDVTSGAGLTGPASGRRIVNNTFVYGTGDYWPAISFNGSGTGVPWFVQSVGGAVITGNVFSGGEQYIRARGTYDNSLFDWESYWNNNTFDQAAVTLDGSLQPAFAVRTYSYVSGSYTMNNVRRIGALVQPQIDNAAAGDTILIDDGLYTENLVVNKHLKLLGAGSGSDPASNTVLRLATPGGATREAVVTITGSGVSDSNPLLLKSLHIEPQGEAGVSLGLTGEANWGVVQNVNYVRLEDVQVVGTANQSHLENERCLNVELNKSVAHLTVVNSKFSQCDHGWYLNKHNGGTFAPNSVQYVTVSNSSFTDNSFKGLYVEMLSDATFDNVVVTGNGLISNWNGAWNAGFDVNLKGDTLGQTRTYQNLVFRNMTMTGNGLGAQQGGALMIKARDDSGGSTDYSLRPAALTNVLIENGIFTGNERGIRLGEPGRNNAGPLNVQIHNAAIYGNTKTYGLSDGSAYGGLVNYSLATVNAENSWWGSASGPTEPGNPGGTGEKVSNANAGAIDYTPWLGINPLAALYVPNAPVDLPLGATGFTLPIMVNAAAGSFSSVAFSLDYDTSCLSINGSDANGDGIPEAITGLPGGFVNSIALNAADANGELDVAMWDVTPPLAVMPSGPILTIKFDILGACQGPLDKETVVKFSATPAPSFSDVSGKAVNRITQGAEPLKLDYNAAPLGLTLSASKVDENKPSGTAVGMLTVNDPDGNAPTFAFVTSCAGPLANGEFAISGAELRTAAVFNYESAASKIVCVEANDGQGGTVTAALSIEIRNINEPPADITLDSTKVVEGASAGTVVGHFATQGDPDALETHTYNLVSGDGGADNGKFEIVGDVLKTLEVFDHSRQPVFYIRVKSTDSGGLFVEKQFVVTVLDHSLLSIGDVQAIKHGETADVKVLFTANGNNPSAAVFGVAYNPACLTFNPTPGASAANGVVTVNVAGPFADGAALIALSFTAVPSCASGTLVPLTFTTASLTGVDGPLPVSTDPGSVLVIANSDRGDCNSDGAVNAGDFSAIVLETFDTDLPWWLDATQSTFFGSPVGCDANASKYIDVADVVCTVLVVFGNSSCTGGTLMASAAVQPSTLAVAPAVDGQSVEVPVTLERKGTTVAGAAFTLTYDPRQAALDMSDADGDGLPDAVVFATASGLKRSVSVDAAGGRIKIAVYGLSLPLPAVDDGLVATVRLQALGDQPLSGLGLIDAALGNDNGSNTPVEVEISGVDVKPLLYLPAVSH